MSCQTWAKKRDQELNKADTPINSLLCLYQFKYYSMTTDTNSSIYAILIYPHKLFLSIRPHPAPPLPECNHPAPYKVGT